MRRRREMAEFSLSFLDVICCGFGAVILLLMITKTVQPQIIEASTVNLEGSSPICRSNCSRSAARRASSTAT
jgi:hypothetical protein